MDEKHFESIITRLEGNSIQQISFYNGAFLDIEKALRFVEGLKYNSSLTYLHMLDHFKPGVLEVLAEGLKCNKSLTILTMERCNLGDEGAILLAQVLKENKVLKELYLPYNCIGEKGVEAIVESLKENNTLKTLSIRHNYIGNVGGVKIAELLMKNSALTTLNISCNYINHEAMKEIYSSLKVNSTLKKVDLIGNSDDPASIADMLKSNHTLTELNAAEYLTEGVSEIFTALKNNSSLVKLSIGYSSELKSLRHEIFVNLKNNYTILDLGNVGDKVINLRLERNKKLFENAFNKASQYFKLLIVGVNNATESENQSKGNKQLYVHSEANINPLNKKDLFLLMRHKEQIKEKFVYTKNPKASYDAFMDELQNYMVGNFFKLKGVCNKSTKEVNSDFPKAILKLIIGNLDFEEALDLYAPKFAPPEFTAQIEEVKITGENLAETHE